MSRLYFLLMGIMFFSCHSGEKTEIAADRIFRFNLPGGVPQMDPVYATSISDLWAVSQLYNTLFQFDDKLNAKKALVESVHVFNKGKSYALRLKRDAYFQDNICFKNGKGRRLTSEDVVFSLSRLNNNQLNSPYQHILSNRLSENWYQLLSTDSLILHLNQPDHSFLSILSMPYTSIIPYEAIEYYKDDFSINPVGTGPFQLNVLESDNGMILKKNDHYWKRNEFGKPLPYLSILDVSFINEPNQELLAFLQDQVDYLSCASSSTLMPLIDPKGKIRAEWNGQMLVQKVPTLEVLYIHININADKNIPDALRNKKFRQALNYSVNKEELVKFIFKDIGDPATSGIVPPSLQLNYMVRGYSHDLEKAKLLIDQSGLDTKSMTGISLAVPDKYMELGRYLQRKWMEDMGIAVSIQEWGGEDNKGMTSLYINNLKADFPTPFAYLESYFGHGDFGYVNSEFNQLFEKAHVSTDSTLDKTLDRMEDIILDEACVIPLIYKEKLRVIKPYVTGLIPTPLNFQSMEKVKFSEGFVIPGTEIESSY